MDDLPSSIPLTFPFSYAPTCFAKGATSQPLQQLNGQTGTPLNLCSICLANTPKSGTLVTPHQDALSFLFAQQPFTDFFWENTCEQLLKPFKSRQKVTSTSSFLHVTDIISSVSECPLPPTPSLFHFTRKSLQLNTFS